MDNMRQVLDYTIENELTSWMEHCECMEEPDEYNWKDCTCDVHIYILARKALENLVYKKQEVPLTLTTSILDTIVDIAWENIYDSDDEDVIADFDADVKILRDFIISQY